MTVTAGIGTTILADELTHATYGTGKAQAIKLLLGAANTGVDAVGGAGVAGTDTLRVAVATDDVNLAAIKTATELIDNAVSGAGFNITQIGGAAAPIGAGVEATALRVTVATDSTGVLSVDDNGASLTVDGTVAVSGTVTVAGAVTNAGTFAVQESGGALTALQIIDDWDESDRAKVNLIVGQAGIAAGTGVDGVTVPRVSLATDVPLPAGTNAIGKMAANSGVDIGDVDVTSVPADPFGVNADAASATGSISAKLRGIATALGVTAFDLGSGTGGSRTLRQFQDTAQWIGGAGVTGTAVQRVVKAGFGTGTITSVADNAASTAILASNAARGGASVSNTSSAVLYLLVGTGAASATNYTVRMVQYGYYEVPAGYTGALTGIWASDPGDGAALVTEWT